MSEGNSSPEGSPLIDPFKRMAERFEHFPWRRSGSTQIKGGSEKNITRATGLPKDPPVFQDGPYETEVASIEEDMLKLCGQLKEPIENGEYGLFIGDDTSGRIPTLALKGFANFISEAFGRGYIKTVFLQAGHIVSEQTVKDQFEKRVLPSLQPGSGQKALLITEHVHSGKTLQRLIDIFQGNNVVVDIAALRIQRNPKGGIPFKGYSCVFEGRLDTEYATRTGYLGGELPPPEIYGQELLSGIRKSVSAAGFFKVISNRNKTNPDAKPMVAAARRDVQRLVSKIVTEIYY